MICYNGGKDALVCLDLVYRHMNSLRSSPLPINALNIREEDSFPELNNFVMESTRRYALNLLTIRSRRHNRNEKTVSAKSPEIFRAVLFANPCIRSLISGLRIQDYAGRMHLCDCLETTSSWPRFERICPIVEWNYRQVWQYIKKRKLAYCKLYDQGYTSIGSKSSTRVNPGLQIGELQFKSPWELGDIDAERNGRD